MEKLTGLRLMAEGALLTNRGVDIITIHGIGGYDSWKYHPNGVSQDSEAVFWVRDFLHADLPSARIFTYSYPSSALCDDQGIDKTASKLLVKLENLQRDNIEVRLLCYTFHPVQLGSSENHIQVFKSTNKPTVPGTSTIGFYLS
jgi:hypothetical protein